MFRDSEALHAVSQSTISRRAKRFYGETLGLKTSTEHYGLSTLHLAGGRDTLVHPKPDHLPAIWSILNSAVDDIDAAVDELISAASSGRDTTAWARTTRASTAPGDPTSPGSRTPPGTSWPSSRSADPRP